MPDLQIPQRQTYPAIRFSVRDEVGLLDLTAAETVDLLLEDSVNPGTHLVTLPVTALDPPENFIGPDGVTHQANGEAPLGGAGPAVATKISYRAKVKIVWSSGPPLLQQYAPQVGFLDIEVVENVAETP
jgi:hypothetical protein